MNYYTKYIDISNVWKFDSYTGRIIYFFYSNQHVMGKHALIKAMLDEKEVEEWEKKNIKTLIWAPDVSVNLTTTILLNLHYVKLNSTSLR